MNRLARLTSLSALGFALAACGQDPPQTPHNPPPVAPPVVAPALTTAQVDAPAARAPADTSGYAKPPQPLLDVMHAPSPPAPHPNATGDKILLVSMVDYPPMARVAEKYVRLAGVRVEPRNRSRHDTPAGYGIRPCVRSFVVVTVPAGEEKKVALPEDACPSPPQWSPDARHFAFQNAGADAVELWVGDASTGEAHRVAGVKLNPMLDNTVQWMADQKTLLVKAVKDDAGAPPPAPAVAVGPSVQETGGEKGESSTYETRDTLNNKHDEDLFDYYATSQLALVDTSNGTVKKVGAPALYTNVDAAPDGAHVLTEVVRKPYSYITTFDRFPYDVAVLDLASGSSKAIASLPLADRVPVAGVAKGPRGFEWRQNEPATLLWAEALDDGDWKKTVPARDKVLMQRAPFTDAAVEVARTEQRFNGFTWGENPHLAFLHEYDENKHWRRVFTLDVDDRAQKPRALFDLSSDEKYKNPGTFVLRRMPNTAVVARQEGDHVFLSGGGASLSGDRPFLDRLDVKNRTTERLFRSDKASYESFVQFAPGDMKKPTIITWHQSPADAPNAFVRTVAAAAESNVAEGEPAFLSQRTAVTHMSDPTPAVRAIKKRLVKYKRKDGVELSFTIYTPPNYVEGTRVPAILNAYPLDYADPKKAGQVTGSEQTFTRLRQYQLLLLAGYAVIDRASFPIVGDPKKAYDTYLEQLVADAKAAVEKAVEIGVVDPERVAVTGHSHGALMTANLLAHSDLFRAGAATSGSYNKTLTPFGFQSERRSVWAAQKVYLQASTFFFADKLKTPILIMHGADDANPGTTPLQATKLYEAIRGNGGTARLVMLPNEPHWYTAMESNEELVAEMLRWFDKYVKNAAPRGKK